MWVFEYFFHVVDWARREPMFGELPNPESPALRALAASILQKSHQSGGGIDPKRCGELSEQSLPVGDSFCVGTVLFVLTQVWPIHSLTESLPLFVVVGTHNNVSIARLEPLVGNNGCVRSAPALPDHATVQKTAGNIG
jgi:hypothetical protein